MRKHEVNNHNHFDENFFHFEHCHHYESLNHLFSESFEKSKEFANKKEIRFIFSSMIQIFKKKAIISFVISSILNETKTRKKRSKRRSKKTVEIVSASVNEIHIINATSFDFLFKQKEAQVFVIFVEKTDIQLAKKKDSSTNSVTLVLKMYHEYLDVFFKDKADRLFSHKKNHDHKIELQEKKMHDYASLYKMSEEELQLVKEYLKENLTKDFIKLNSAFYSSLILFVRKSSEEL